jgi:hypothetical protein
MRPRRQAGEECGESSRSGAQYFSFNFLSGYSFSGLGSQHMVDTEIQDAKFCWSKLYLATDVRNFILDEAMGRKGSRICYSNDDGNLAKPIRAGITSLSRPDCFFQRMKRD